MPAYVQHRLQNEIHLFSFNLLTLHVVQKVVGKANKPAAFLTQGNISMRWTRTSGPESRGEAGEWGAGKSSAAVLHYYQDLRMRFALEIILTWESELHR